ncbi:MAG: SMP-30/gluconolactonase/LRE family protein [Gemmatimonadetes bacterium]|nr:SMP-30/gluconolactonase/LRE family protein [Gemmatimonadota bacterium]
MDARNGWSRVGMLATLALAACGGDTGENAAAGGDDAATMPADTQVVVVADAGFETPESVLHDAAADVYLVSNINGQPLDRDGNGFISRVRPDGTVDELKWIEGGAGGVRLNAPKGMALKGDTLFVTDIDSVRAFHRETGRSLGARGVPDADFLNDLAVADDALYVTDTGVDASFSPTGNAAIYRFGVGGVETVARGDSLASPNGIAVEGGEMLVAPFGSGEVRRIDLAEGGAGQVVATLPGGQLDGIVRLADGAFLVSSWETSTVYRVAADGTAEAIVEDVPSPADIGWDAERRRVLIPVFMEDRVEIHPVR